MTDHGEQFGSIAITLIALPAAGLAVGTGVTEVLKARRESRTLVEGLPAEAVVLDTYVTRRRTRTRGADGRTVTRTTVTRHAVLAFRTPDGREIRIDETDGGRRATGDRLTVRYLPERPQEIVPTDHPNPRAALATGTVIGLVLLGVFTAISLFFAAVGFGFAAFTPDIPDFPAPGETPAFPKGF